MNKRKEIIGRGELIALIVSSCIGTGIFGITSDVAAAAAQVLHYWPGSLLELAF